MRRFVCIFLALGCAALLARATAADAAALALAVPAADEPLIIMLTHHWVVEFAGQRFGLIEFDTPMTTVLLGQLNFDLPVRALVVLAPLVTLPALALIGVVALRRRIRQRAGAW